MSVTSPCATADSTPAELRVPSAREAAVGEQQQQPRPRSEQEVALGHRQHASPAARSTSSPSMRTANVSGSTAMSGSASFSGRSALAKLSRVGDRHEPSAHSEPVGQPVVERRLGDPRHRQRRCHRRRRPEHRAGQLRLRRRDRGVGVAHRGPGDHPALERRDAGARRRTPGPTARGRRACRPRPSRPRPARPCVIAGQIVYLAT